jgi:hypothetical protein
MDGVPVTRREVFGMRSPVHFDTAVRCQRLATVVAAVFFLLARLTEPSARLPFPWRFGGHTPESLPFLNGISFYQQAAALLSIGMTPALLLFFPGSERSRRLWTNVAVAVACVLWVGSYGMA